jgi:hypothetical protein
LLVDLCNALPVLYLSKVVRPSARPGNARHHENRGRRHIPVPSEKAQIFTQLVPLAWELVIAQHHDSMGVDHEAATSLSGLEWLSATICGAISSCGARSDG